MHTMTMNQMKRLYQQTNKKVISLKKQINNYDTLISSLLVEIRGLGEKLDVSTSKDMLLLLYKEKSKLEAKLVSVYFDKNVLSAKINNIFSRMLKSNSAVEIFTSLNEKYESYSIPIEFTYEYISEKDDVKNVTFFKASLKEGGIKGDNDFEG